MSKTSRNLIITSVVAIAGLGGWIAITDQHDDSQPSYTRPSVMDFDTQTHQEGFSSNIESAVEETPVVETKIETATKDLPFETQYIDDNTLARGTTKTIQNGRNGVETTTYSVTYTDGVETAREMIGVETTQQPLAKVIARGTYVAPQAIIPQNCSNGTYVNSAGNTVCRPVQSDARPSGATARCRDGSYSYSQSRRGTCSRHGGVAQWY